MSDFSSHSTLQYLPVEVSDRLFAIPMPDVVTIQRVQVGNSENGSATETEEQPSSGITTIDLRHLFWQDATASSKPHVIVVRTRAGTCALLVDAVRAARTVDKSAVDALPQLANSTAGIFSGVVHEPEPLTLILNTQRLVKHLRQAAPDLIVENDDYAA